MAASRLRLTKQQILKWALVYDSGPQANDQEVLAIGVRAREAGEFSLEDLRTVCKWKSPRSYPRCLKNRADEVAEITRISLSTGVERLRIEVLRCLHGVDWPTASVLLHLAHRDPYPILDVRAIWSLGLDKPSQYCFRFWWEYVQRCRRIASRYDVNMRTLDRALWQYSKEHQGPLA